MRKSKCDGCIYYGYLCGFGLTIPCCLYTYTGKTRTKRQPDGTVYCPPPGKGSCPYYKTHGKRYRPESGGDMFFGGGF